MAFVPSDPHGIRRRSTSSSSRNLFFPLLLILLISVLAVPSSGHPLRHKRQTFHYPNELREYAQNYHPGTRVIHGTLGRFAPQDWPSWYTRTMMSWNGLSRMAPYSPNDVQYRGWRLNRIMGDRP